MFSLDFRICLMIDLGRKTDDNNEICLSVRFALCVIKPLRLIGIEHCSWKVVTHFLLPSLLCSHGLTQVFRRVGSFYLQTDQNLLWRSQSSSMWSGGMLPGKFWKNGAKSCYFMHSGGKTEWLGRVRSIVNYDKTYGIFLREFANICAVSNSVIYDKALLWWSTGTLVELSDASVADIDRNVAGNRLMPFRFFFFSFSVPLLYFFVSFSAWKGNKEQAVNR